MKHYFPSTLLPVYAPSRGCYLPVESLRATRPISFVALVPLTQVRSLFASRGSMLPSLLYQRIVLAAARAGGVHLDFRLYSQSRWCPCNVDFDTVSSPSHALPCRIDPSFAAVSSTSVSCNPSSMAWRCRSMNTLLCVVLSIPVSRDLRLAVLVLLSLAMAPTWPSMHVLERYCACSLLWQASDNHAPASAFMCSAPASSWKVEVNG